MSLVIDQPRVGPDMPSMDSDLLHEVIDGKVVELPPMGVLEAGIANLLSGFLWEYHLKHPVGRPFVEVLFRLDKAGKLDRRPDVAFVAYESWPDRLVPDVEAWEIIPAVAVEVVSKSNTVDEIEKKIGEYFLHGVKLVWIIHPRERLVHVYEGRKNMRILDTADTLDGGQVLPGFRLMVSKLFE